MGRLTNWLAHQAEKDAARTAHAVLARAETQPDLTPTRQAAADL